MPINMGVIQLKLHRSRQGFGLIDIVIALFLLGMAGLMFAAALPSGFRCSQQAQQNKTAAAIAQRKMEQIRAMNYESLTQPLLCAAGVIDADSTSSPYSFTSVDNLGSQLTSGTGSIAITDADSDIKLVKITVRWAGASSSGSRSLCLTTLISDKRPRRVN